MAACPIGVLLALSLQGVNSQLQAVGLSMSAGTFLYVGAAEIIAEEFSVQKRKNMKTKIGFLILGIILISSVMITDKMPSVEDSDETIPSLEENQSFTNLNPELSDGGNSL